MSFRVFWIWMFLPLCFLADRTFANEPTDDSRYAMVKLLDAQAPAADRQATFDYFNKLALAGNTAAQYLIGSLYRIGDRLPGNVAPRDLDMANKYLSTAAAHGHLRAMAKMAELELSRKHYLEAMIWAQLFGYYAGLNGADAKTIKDSSEAAYLADLIRRVADRLDAKQMPTVQENMNVVIAEHDADIRKGMAGGANSFGSSSGRLEYRNSGRHKFVDPPRHGEPKDVLADYLVAFDAKGEAAQAWLIDALPDVDLGKSLKVVALGVEINEDPAASGLRWGVVPINFSWGRSHLLPAKK
ncbi:MAG: sel1 repeat family protein [Rudaea sp.]|uniref:sel1 repeat family protein n=1 Tax=unclassified Rudaea TaxID=2627037 RepID=UPI0010F7CFAF|nr:MULTISPECIES: sel1 repeat family protein [unclassified Rudaea]MBN8887388.1 sel1 repeat family protein [Rudaea sp.]MBR0344914.1 sel1 repeat family protein [Rudaea sp.]